MNIPSRCGLRRVALLCAVACSLSWALPVAAQDARRGAALYMQVPGGGASCVSCHGPEPQGNRNSLLKAADNPQALTKALSTVGVMSFLRASLDDTAIADLAAFLGSVNRASAVQESLTLWPLTADFGSLGLGTVGGPQQVSIFNRGSAPLRLNAPQVQGGPFELQSDCPAVLPAGAACRALVTAWATQAGPFTGALSVSSPDVAGLFAVALAGITRPVTAGLLQWSPDPGIVNFGSVPAGQTASRPLTLINAGTQPVTLGAPPAVAGSLSLTGPNLAPLTVSGCTAGTVLAPADTCTIQVQASAGSPVAAKAILQVRSNGGNPPALRIEADAVAAATPAATTPPTTAASAPAAAPAAPASGGAVGLPWLAGLVLAAGWLRRRTDASRTPSR